MCVRGDGFICIEKMFVLVVGGEGMLMWERLRRGPRYVDIKCHRYDKLGWR